MDIEILDKAVEYLKRFAATMNEDNEAQKVEALAKKLDNYTVEIDDIPICPECGHGDTKGVCNECGNEWGGM